MTETKRITKVFPDFPAAHRQHDHDGHCATIHGHNWTFEIVFEGPKDSTGFVLDFGKMGPLRGQLKYFFDHTLLLSESDPEKTRIMDFLHGIKQNNVRILPAVTAEGIAEMVQVIASEFLHQNVEKDGNTSYDRGVRVIEVTVYEDSKNSATWYA